MRVQSNNHTDFAIVTIKTVACFQQHQISLIYLYYDTSDKVRVHQQDIWARYTKITIAFIRREMSEG